MIELHAGPKGITVEDLIAALQNLPPGVNITITEAANLEWYRGRIEIEIHTPWEPQFLEVRPLRSKLLKEGSGA